MTLVEIMFAMVLFGFGMLSISLMYIQCFRTFDASRNVTQVSQILQNQMEGLRSVSTTSIQDQTGTKTYTATDLNLPNLNPSTGAPFGWTSFSLTQTISAINTDLYDIHLTATWENRYGIPGTAVFNTQIAHGGLNDFFTRTEP